MRRDQEEEEEEINYQVGRGCEEIKKKKKKRSTTKLVVVAKRSRRRRRRDQLPSWSWLRRDQEEEEEEINYQVGRGCEEIKKKKKKRSTTKLVVVAKRSRRRRRRDQLPSWSWLRRDQEEEEINYQVGRGCEAVRTSDSHPGSNHIAAVSKLMSFTPGCSSSVSCIRATDGGGYVNE